MDFSLEFVEACEASQEIQKFGKELEDKTPFDIFVKTKSEDNKIVFVPRQDQLQDMMSFHFRFSGLEGLLEGIGTEFPKIFKENGWADSMEKLWLCYYMGKVNNKQYNCILKQWENKI